MESSEFKFSHEFDSVSTINDEGEFSKTHIFKDMPWYLRACTTPHPTKNEEGIGFYLYCNDDDWSREWKCWHETVFTLFRDGKKNIGSVSTNTKLDESFDSTNFKWGHIVSKEDLLESVEGGKLTVEVCVNVIQVTGIRKIQAFDFSSPGYGTDNVVFKLDDRRIHVGKQYLSMHSPVFASMFYQSFKEKNEAEIELHDVVSEEFEELLLVTYPSNKRVTYDSCRFILELADRYDIQKATDAAEDFLLNSWRFKLFDKLVIADAFRLDRLTNQCMLHYKTLLNINFIKHVPEFAKFSDKTQRAIEDRLIELTPKEKRYHFNFS